MREFTRDVYISHDSEADAAYVSFGPGRAERRVAATVPIRDEAGFLVGALDFDEAGRVLGLELLAAAKVIPESWTAT